MCQGKRSASPNLWGETPKVGNAVPHDDLVRAFGDPCGVRLGWGGGGLEVEGGVVFVLFGEG